MSVSNIRITLLLSLFFLFSCTEKEVSKPVNSFSNSEINKIQDGDIILKCGYGTLSSTIVRLLNEEKRISHCGFLFRKNDSLLVMHSVAKEYSDADGVQIANISSFLNDTKPNSLFVVRIKQTENIKEQIFDNATDYLTNKTAFDYDFNHSDDSKLYCSEFVYRSITDAAPDIPFRQKNVQGKKIITFNSFLNANYFEIIVSK